MKEEAYLHVEHTGEKLQKTIALEVSIVAEKEALVNPSHLTFVVQSTKE